ncbi:MAG: NADPH:quinone reductase [Rhizobiaceae bacterium]
MRAIRVHKFGGPEELTLDDIPEPVVGPGEVLVDVRAVGVNPVDTYIRSGIHAIRPELPFVTASDAAGVVAALGNGVTEYTIGDRVYLAGFAGGYFKGVMAERVAVPLSAVQPLPDNISFAAGAALGVPYATAYYALEMRGKAKPGQTLFIHGASGSVGTALIQMARARGLTVIGSAGSDAGCKLVLEQGAHHALNHHDDDYMDDLSRLTGGQGPELIIEMLANVNLATDLDAVAKYGRIVIVGNRGEVTINARVAMMKDLDIVGLALNNATPDEMSQIEAGLQAGLSSGILQPVIREELKMEEARAAHEKVLEPGALGKIIVTP